MHEPWPTPPTSRIAQTDVRCPRCGYNLTGVTIGGSCPECGERVAPIHARPTSGYAVTSMTLGIVSLPSCVACGVPSLVCGVLAIVFYFLARREIADGRVSAGSAGMALTGLITGIIGLGLFAIFVWLAAGDGVWITF